MKKIVIFASGNGTNAENIIKYFDKDPKTGVAAIFTNNAKAGVIKRAEKLSVPVYVFNREMLYESNRVIEKLKTYNPALIVLAGFLWKIPARLIKEFSGKIINIHPALLPKFGGKGMYGMYVHEKVVTSGEKESGITIHWVDENYDSGNIIARFKVQLSENETPNTLAEKIHSLEYTHYPKVIENVLKKI